MAKGISTTGDVLVNVTADGVDLNEIWAEIADALALYNAERSAVARLLSYPTVVPADAVPQSISWRALRKQRSLASPGRFGLQATCSSLVTVSRIGTYR